MLIPILPAKGKELGNNKKGKEDQVSRKIYLGKKMEKREGKLVRLTVTADTLGWAADEAVGQVEGQAKTT